MSLKFCFHASGIIGTALSLEFKMNTSYQKDVGFSNRNVYKRVEQIGIAIARSGTFSFPPLRIREAVSFSSDTSKVGD